MTAKSRILKTIHKNNKAIKRYGARSVGIFGSFATSAQKENSDIDILIEFQKGKKAFDNYMELKFFLEKLFHRKVDLVIKEALKSGLKKHVLREVVYAEL